MTDNSQNTYSFSNFLKQKIDIDFSNEDNYNKFYNCLNKYIPLVISIFLCIDFIFVAVTDFNMFTNSYFVYTILITLPILFSFTFWIPIIKNYNISYKWKFIWTIFIVISTILLTILISYLYNYLSPSEILAIGIIRIVIFIFFTLFIIYIVYIFLFKHSIETKGILGFLLKLLLLIPNIIIYTSKYIYNNISFYNFFYFIIIFIIILIILFYIYFDLIFNYITNIGSSTNNNNNNNNNSELILSGPIPIYSENTYSIKNPPSSPNYTLSFWIYINNIPITNNELSLFNYGLNSPSITISNNNQYYLNFYASHYFYIYNKSYNFTITTQKWNYIVIQYTNNSVQLYLNCNLIYSINFNSSNTPVYSSSDNLIIGSNNDINLNIGAISNINYYSYPITLSQMNTQYTILSSQNIPI